MQILHDARGPYVVVPFEDADATRARLIASGIRFEEEEGAGCAGPVWAVLRLDASALAARDADRHSQHEPRPRSGEGPC